MPDPKKIADFPSYAERQTLMKELEQLEQDGIAPASKEIYKQYDGSLEEDFIVKSGLNERTGHVAPISMVLDDFLNYKY